MEGGRKQKRGKCPKKREFTLFPNGKDKIYVYIIK